MIAQSRSLFDAPQAIEKPTMLFVPMAFDVRGAQAPSRSREARPEGVALTGLSTVRRYLSRVRRHPSLSYVAVRAVFRLVQRLCVAEAITIATACLCALAGFPAIVTAFSVALVQLVVSLWLAVRTLGLIAGRLFRGRY